jgi:hypothetical protein
MQSKGEDVDHQYKMTNSSWEIYVGV